MKVLSIRFSTVTPRSDEMVKFFAALGLPKKDLSEFPDIMENFSGGIFLAGESWVEVWQNGPDMPEGVMLQIVVDDADAFAQQARENGLHPEGPMEEHGERIYFLESPSGMPVSFQSKLK